MPLDAGSAIAADASGVSGGVWIPARQSCDPLGFTLAMLGARGALVEAEASHALAVLPPELATELGLPEDCRLGLEDADTVSCGFGSPLLERLTEQACAGLAVAHAVVDADLPRAARARSLAEAFVVRNGVTELIECLPGSADYLLSVASWVAEADDRFEGLAFGAVCAADGGWPHLGLEEALASEARGHNGPMTGTVAASPGVAMQEAEVARALQRLRQLVTGRAAKSVEPLVAGVARRHAREHARVAEYFEAMLVEVAERKRRIDPETLASRMMAIIADRDGKLRDLHERFALRVRLRPIALASFRVPCVVAKVRVRRRQLDRVIALRLPALAQSLDQLACDACDGFTQRPAVCDQHLHLLCERCAPEARGRLACPACA